MIAAGIATANGFATPDRTAALTCYLQEASRGAFDWQTNNCASFVAGWIMAWRGVQLGSAFIHAAASRAAADQVVRDAGFDNLSDLAAAVLHAAGIDEIAPAAAAVGDIGAVLGVGHDGASHETLAICLGPRWAALAPRGLTIGAGRALRAWRI